MMPLNATSYPFEFIGISTLSADEFQQDTLIYRFRSRKSAHEYEVHIERYREHLCSVKFFDTSAYHGIGRFSQLTETFEPRTVIRTVTDIALHSLGLDPMASFCFIGAADGRDHTGGANTRRYRVYKAYVQRMGIDDRFEAIFFDEYSLIMLVNRQAVVDRQTYIEQVVSFII